MPARLGVGEGWPDEVWWVRDRGDEISTGAAAGGQVTLIYRLGAMTSVRVFDGGGSEMLAENSGGGRVGD